MVRDLLERAEARRRSTLTTIDPEAQAQRGQYFTPHLAARIIAGLPRVPQSDSIRVLDPGAGSGILSAALVDRFQEARPGLRIHVVALENDPTLHAPLRETLADVEKVDRVTTELVSEDFLTWALSTDERFDVVIQNPPYAKLRTGSAEQSMLRRAGIVVPNIYAAFLALATRLLVDGGQLVAITPRSWMNGSYYAAFRKQFVQTVSIDTIHTFESRSKVFGDTGVLQESIVVSSTKGVRSDQIVIHTSHDHSSEPSSRSVPFEEIVTPDFIHVPVTDADARAVAWMAAHAHYTLADLGLTVSTGRVVDFRSREMLHHEQVEGAVPMLHASHVRGAAVQHPVGAKKPEWFRADPISSDKLLVPAGTYVLIKRFSAKEERRRVVSALWQSEDRAAFDNKLNYVHQDGHGLDPEVARGLSVFLNSTQLDNYFRVFSGHTQVNATDLRQMRFPSLEQLWALSTLTTDDQAAIDEVVEATLAASEVPA